MGILTTIATMIGSLGLFLYGMSVLSAGIQKAAGDTLKRTLRVITDNPVKGVLTGTFITTIIQSSSATTVMVVTFVNAGLLTVYQAAGVIFGANIGTTITAWIVSLIGFKFKISALALPMIGVGFLAMLLTKTKNRTRDYAEAAIGFGLLFLGLEYLSHALPKPEGSVLSFLGTISNHGIITTLFAVLIGMIVTIILHSSSATTAIVITLVVQNVINFELAAGLVLGCNIGTTIDALLASIGATVNAKRAALIHTLFNIFGTIVVIVFIKPFMQFVLLLTGQAAVAQQVAMFHTLFNIFTTLLILPFTKQFCNLVSVLIKDKEKQITPVHTELTYISLPFMNSPELNLLRAQKEIADMSQLALNMFIQFRRYIEGAETDFNELKTQFSRMENYADEMREELTRFLLQCAQQELSPGSSQNISVFLRMVVELEDITDDCYRLLMLLEKAQKRDMCIDKSDFDTLLPYITLVNEFLLFVSTNINDRISEEQFNFANSYEDKIDEFKSVLKKETRKKIQTGSDVKYELLMLDMIRHIEKIGDHAFNVAQNLRELQ